MKYSWLPPSLSLFINSKSQTSPFPLSSYSQQTHKEMEEHDQQFPPPPPFPPPSCTDPHAASLEIDWIAVLSGQVTGDFSPAAATCESSEMKTDEEKGNSMRNGGRRWRRDARRRRFEFQTRSAEDILDDGYRWRKYGQKAVKHSLYPRYKYKYNIIFFIFITKNIKLQGSKDLKLLKSFFLKLLIVLDRSNDV